jgi:hypothetical protein
MYTPILSPLRGLHLHYIVFFSIILLSATIMSSLRDLLHYTVIATRFEATTVSPLRGFVQ